MRKVGTIQELLTMPRLELFRVIFDDPYNPLVQWNGTKLDKRDYIIVNWF